MYRRSAMSPNRYPARCCARAGMAVPRRRAGLPILQICFFVCKIGLARSSAEGGTARALLCTGRNGGAAPACGVADLANMLFRLQDRSGTFVG
jgi:hypothetical protein